MKYLTVFGTIEFGNTKIDGKISKSYIGGNAIAASLAASLQLPVYLMGVVGTDMDMDVLKKLLGNGIHCDNVEQYDGNSFHYTAVYDTESFDVKDHIIDFGVYGNYNPLVQVDEIKNTEAILLSGSNPKYSLHALKQLRGPHSIGVSTMLYHLEHNYHYASDLIKEATHLFTNKKEYAYLKEKIPNLFAFANKLTYIFITDGKNGVQVLTRNDEQYFSFEKTITPHDPTNAGDVFAGSVMGQLLTGLSPQEDLDKIIAHAHTEAMRVISNDPYYRKVYEEN